MFNLASISAKETGVFFHHGVEKLEDATLIRTRESPRNYFGDSDQPTGNKTPSQKVAVPKAIVQLSYRLVSLLVSYLGYRFDI
jgi:hypothetical protein